MDPPPIYAIKCFDVYEGNEAFIVAAVIFSSSRSRNYPAVFGCLLGRKGRLEKRLVSLAKQCSGPTHSHIV